MIMAVIYGPGEDRRLAMGTWEQVGATLADWIAEGGVGRRLDGGPLASVATIADPRLPQTLEAFDAAYPDAPPLLDD